MLPDAVVWMAWVFWYCIQMKYNEYIQSSWVKRQIKRHGSDLCDGLISSLLFIDFWANLLIYLRKIMIEFPIECTCKKPSVIWHLSKKNPLCNLAPFKKNCVSVLTHRLFGLKNMKRNYCFKWNMHYLSISH